MKKLAISTGLAAKGAAGAAAIATTTSLGAVYRDSIFGWGITNEEINKKLEGLGLPNDCKFDAEGKTKDCGSQGDAALKEINFEKGKAITTMDTSVNNPTLVLERTDDWKIFPDGFKLIFKTTSKVTIAFSSGLLELEKGTNTEFKIKTVKGEKKIGSAWTPENIGEKVGITCSSDTSCTLGEKISVWRGDDDYVTNAAINGDNKAINISKDSENHNQGFKFTVSNDVSLSGGNQKKTTGGISQLTKTGKTYEIGIKEINGQKIWFLIEKAVQ